MLEQRLWPRSGARAQLRFFDGMSVGAAVFEVGAEEIELSVRTNAHRVRGTEGTSAQVEWNTETSHVYARGTVVAVDPGLPLRCTLRFDQAAKAVQRRSYVRIAMTGVLPKVKLSYGSSVEEGRLADISEGGMRLRVPEQLGLESGSLVHVTVELDGTEHELPSKVVRVMSAAPDTTGGGDPVEQVEVGVHFEENDDIRRWVFKEQLRRRNREGQA